MVCRIFVRVCSSYERTRCPAGSSRRRRTTSELTALAAVGELRASSGCGCAFVPLPTMLPEQGIQCEEREGRGCDHGIGEAAIPWCHISVIWPALQLFARLRPECFSRLTHSRKMKRSGGWRSAVPQLANCVWTGPTPGLRLCINGFALSLSRLLPARIRSGHYAFRARDSAQRMESPLRGRGCSA